MSIVALASHSRRCDGGNWRCKWCECKADECSGKNPGPDGPATLCGACGARYRGGATGPPPTNAEGNFLCEDCGEFKTNAWAFILVALLSLHSIKMTLLKLAA